MAKPKIVCLCGSTRFRREFELANAYYTRRGWIVLAPGVFGHSGDAITDIEKQQLDALHYHKILMADMVICVCPGKYIGKSTQREINFASAAGFEVEFRVQTAEQLESEADDE